jgi:hypothetical protein
MRRIGAIGALAVLVLLPPGSGDRPLTLHAQPAATAKLLGIVGDNGGSRVAELDPVTLAPLRASPLVGYVDAWVRSPDGASIAFATSTRTTVPDRKLRFLDPSTLQWSPQVVDLDGGVSGALWPSSDRIVALVYLGNGIASVETIDTAAGKVVARQPVLHVISVVRRSADGLVALGGPKTGLGPARLVVVGADAQARTVTLRRISMGTRWRWSRSTPVGTYVVDAGGLVARVDLRDLSVTYHLPAKPLAARLAAWLTAPAEAKMVSGPVRTADWLGDGVLAVSGMDYFASRKRVSSTPAGLRVIDTRDWMVRTIDPQAGSFVIAEGLLLATGTRYHSDTTGTSTVSTGEGVAAYGPDGRLRWRVDAGTSRGVVTAYGSAALTWRSGDDPYQVIDLSSGRTVRTGASYTTLLLGPGS